MPAAPLGWGASGGDWPGVSPATTPITSNSVASCNVGTALSHTSNSRILGSVGPSLRTSHELVPLFDCRGQHGRALLCVQPFNPLDRCPFPLFVGAEVADRKCKRRLLCTGCTG